MRGGSGRSGGCASYTPDAAPAGIPHTFAPDALALFGSYDFPGNVRELRGMVERGVLLASDGVIRAEHLQGEDSPMVAPSPAPAPASDASQEAAAIVEALQRCAGNQTLAAKELGVSRRTLINRIIAYGIARPRKAGD